MSRMIIPDAPSVLSPSSRVRIRVRVRVRVRTIF